MNKELKIKKGAPKLATGPAGPMPRPAYCGHQCYGGKCESWKTCECKGCSGKAHGLGKKYAFDNGFLKNSPADSHKPTEDQEELFLEEAPSRSS